MSDRTRKEELLQEGYAGDSEDLNDEEVQQPTWLARTITRITKKTGFGVALLFFVSLLSIMTGFLLMEKSLPWTILTALLTPPTTLLAGYCTKGCFDHFMRKARQRAPHDEDLISFVQDSIKDARFFVPAMGLLIGAVVAVLVKFALPHIEPAYEMFIFAGSNLGVGMFTFGVIYCQMSKAAGRSEVSAVLLQTLGTDGSLQPPIQQHSGMPYLRDMGIVTSPSSTSPPPSNEATTQSLN